MGNGSVRNSGGQPDENLTPGGGHHKPCPFSRTDGEGIVAVAASTSIVRVEEMMVR